MSDRDLLIEIREDVKHLRSKQDALSDTVTGMDRTIRGHNGHKGHAERIGILEDKDRTSRWHFGLVWTAIVALGTAFLKKAGIL